MAENRYPEFDNTQKSIEIGYNIAYYRKHAGLTQEQLAERVGISRQHIGITCAIERLSVNDKKTLYGTGYPVS